MHVFRLWEEAWVSGRTCNSTQKGPDLLAMRKQCSPPHQRAVCSLMICSKWYNSGVMYLQTATFLPTKQSYCFHYADDAGLHHHFLHLLSSLWGMTSNAPSHLLAFCYMCTLAYYKSFTHVFQSYTRHTHYLSLGPAVFVFISDSRGGKTAMLAGSVRRKRSPCCAPICGRKYF